MTRQRGFTLYLALAALLAFGGLSAYAWYVKRDRDAIRKEYDGFVDRTALLGVQAEEAAKKQEAKDLANKRKIDRENNDLRESYADAIKRLRESGAGSRGVPEAPASSSRPDLACYDRPEFVGAYGRLVTGVRGLADEGTASAIDLNSARRWAQDR